MTRDELTHMIDLAERLLAVGDHGVLATLFRAGGSTYRPLGSMMVGGPPPIIAGGVSGGCLEQYVARQGRLLTQAMPAAMLSFATDPDVDDGKPVLGCGGSIEVLVERLSTEHLEFLKQLRYAATADHYCTSACVIDTAAGQISSVARFWLNDDRQDECLSRLHRRAVHDRRPRHGAINHARQALIYYVPPMTRLVIFGAGDDVKPLVTVAKSLGWHVTVADRRARFATTQRFGEADQIIAGEWRSAVNRICFTANTAVALMTHSLPDDIELLPLLADKPLGYIGALGPAHRRGWLIDGATEGSYLGDQFISRLRGPIGLNLGDRSAAGIAVSIVSEILAEMNSRAPAPLSSAPAPLVHEPSSTSHAMVIGG